jgi:hypothetical protein
MRNPPKDEAKGNPVSGFPPAIHPHSSDSLPFELWLAGISRNQQGRFRTNVLHSYFTCGIARPALTG